ncbi:hypothetical protein CABS03_00976 [Colletotrichum abscissum]|uniref:Uncharacterized protein n=2 Tax=Colletotrichum acutatum species complex TaxID=2707335 RepID=A0A9P9XA60_9PEZI|nr:hypothetical protein CABS02_10312 [Colletotrichum abscissum]KAK0379627.1 hypothetical protein CLIM01_03018 [Colletotrichum limetticola]
MRFVICEFVNDCRRVGLHRGLRPQSPHLQLCAEGENALFSGWQLCICMSMNADMDRRGDLVPPAPMPCA